MVRPLLLLPSSKRKAPGGHGPAYADVDGWPELAPARKEALDAVVSAAEEADDATIARLSGVRPEGVAEQRAALAVLAEAPTMAAHERYTGVVAEHAGLADLDPSEAGADGLILGGLLGAAGLSEPVPDYRLEVTGRAPGLGVLATWWRDRLAEPMARLVADRPVWDLLPGELARLWPARVRPADAEIMRLDLRRADGRAAPSALAKQAKGRLAGLLLREPGLDATTLLAEQPLTGWRLEASDDGLRAVLDD